jgi:hypothetical protein
MIETQVAFIGAAAVLLAALLSVLAAVISANLAARAAARNTSETMTGETERSKAEFLRSQRQRLYAKIVADEDALISEESSWQQNLLYSLLTNEGDYDAQKKRVNDLLSAFTRDRAPLEVIGSAPVRQIYDKLLDSHTGVVSVGKDYQVAKFSAQDTSQIQLVMDDALAEVGELRERLSSACRADMGST